MNTLVATAFLVISGSVPQQIQTVPQPDGSSIVTANYVTSIPGGCTFLPTEEGFTKYKCTQNQEILTVAP